MDQDELVKLSDDEQEEMYVFAIPDDEDEDEDMAEVVFAIVPLEEGLAILDQA